MTTITFDNLTKAFDEVTAVDGIDLEIRDGEFLVVVGPSGCGKSTTLRMLAGLEPITGGTIEFGDRVVNDVDAADRDVAMVFQNYALYPHMSARENMAFGLPGTGVLSNPDAEDDVADVADLLGITELLDRTPDELSGGEKQRVAIGRALLRDPEVLLMDEPLSNLDAKLRVEMRAELAELHAELARTTVYVTHDQTEAMTLGDRVAVLRDGTLQQVAPPQELYDYPTNRFVASFVGNPSMNLLPTVVESDGRTWSARLDSGSAVSLPATESLREFGSGEAQLGVRPESFGLAADGELQMDVRVRETLGETVLLRGTIGGTDCAVKVDPHTDVATGDRVRVTVDERRLHLFDVETGEAVYHSWTEESETTTDRTADVHA